MDLRRALIPYHFGIQWDIIPNRVGTWETIYAKCLASRLSMAHLFKPDILVSGDCMAAIAAHRDGLDLVWMDAHGDFHTLLTTETGNIGGMPLAMLCGVGDQSFIHCCNHPRVESVWHVGGSEFDDGEVSRMKCLGVSVLDRISSWCGSKRRIHLHIDTDVICSDDLPSSIHPAPRGMLLKDFYDQLNVLLPHADVLSIKTYDPRLDIGGIGESIVLEIIRRFENERTH